MYHAHKHSLDLESKITMESVYERFEKKPEEEDKKEAEQGGDQEGGSGEEAVKKEVFEANKRVANWEERSSIKQACEALKQGRCTLMYSYVFCFYLKDNTGKTLFEDCQKYLQSKVERLSEFLEREVHTLVDKNKFRELDFIVKFCKEQSAKTIDCVKENKWEFLDL